MTIGHKKSCMIIRNNLYSIIAYKHNKFYYKKGRSQLMQKKFLIISITIMLITSTFVSAQQIIQLPKPKIHGKLMKALKNRSTYRNFSSKEISLQLLSEVLWAAYGVNNERTGRRTVATAFNVREMFIYVLTKDGSFLYDAPKQMLVQITDEDTRELVATQDFVKNVPVHLIYVADLKLLLSQSPEWSHGFVEGYSTMHTGQIAQNVYLYCASKRLGTVVRDVVNEEVLGKKLKLDENRKIIISQVIGYPGK